MTCPSCRGACETSPNGQYARCTQCQKIYMTYGGELRPVQLPPGTDPALFAAGIGFGTPGGPQLPPDPMTATKNAFAERASNIGVRAKVGGVTVDMNKGGVSVDTSKLQKNLERKVEQKVSQWIWGCVFTVFFFGVVAALLVVVGGYVIFAVADSSGGGSASAEAATWDGKSTFTCPPNGNVTLEGVTANLDGTAIEAGGNCKLTLVDMDITAATAIEAGGNAVITITGGHLKGTENSISAMGNSTVNVFGTKVEGPVNKMGNGKVNGL